MFIVALLTISKIWNQPKCEPTDEWIKITHTHTHTHTHTLTPTLTHRNIIQLFRSFVTTWMNLGDIILSET